MFHLKHTMAPLFAALLFAPSAFAADNPALTVEGAYARAVPPTAGNSAAFMQIRNNSNEARQLVAAEADVSNVTELHNHIQDNGVMRMRRVDAIDVPANGAVELKPGSYHVMLIDLKQPLKEGDTVNIELRFDDGSSKDVSMPAQKVMGGMMHHGKHHH